MVPSLEGLGARALGMEAYTPHLGIGLGPWGMAGLIF